MRRRHSRSPRKIQAFPARHEDRKRRAGLQQTFHESAGARKMLEIVEHQQTAGSPDRRYDGFLHPRFGAPSFQDFQLPGDSPGNQGSVPKRGQLHDIRASGEIGLHGSEDVPRQEGLSDPPSPRDRAEPAGPASEEGNQFGELLVPPDHPAGTVDGRPVPGRGFRGSGEGDGGRAGGRVGLSEFPRQALHSTGEGAAKLDPGYPCPFVDALRRRPASARGLQDLDEGQPGLFLEGLFADPGTCAGFRLPVFLQTAIVGRQPPQQDAVLPPEPSARGELPLVEIGTVPEAESGQEGRTPERDGRLCAGGAFRTEQVGIVGFAGDSAVQERVNIDPHVPGVEPEEILPGDQEPVTQRVVQLEDRGAQVASGPGLAALGPEQGGDAVPGMFPGFHGEPGEERQGLAARKLDRPGIHLDEGRAQQFQDHRAGHFFSVLDIRCFFPPAYYSRIQPLRSQCNVSATRNVG